MPRRIYDLSQPVFSNCPQYPDTNPRPVEVQLFYMLAVQGVNKEVATLTTHSGTHCDAPYHFFEQGATIDEIPLERYVGWAVLLDLRKIPPGAAIEAHDIAPFLQRVRAGDVALLNTGGGARRANSPAFLTEYVWLSGEAARLLVERGVKGVGIDAVSLGGYNDAAKAGPAHRHVLGSGAFVAEDLFFPDEVMDGRRRLFVAAPVKMRRCSGAWTRAMLWEYDDEENVELKK
ncbi:MAG: cyclase family protein [Candidatus Eremiobacteraeota bacterium]|nr:cyclase family protein [Candidatus Eremiobacteraeota bacterium]